MVRAIENELARMFRNFLVSSAGQQSPAAMAYFDGFADGYQSVGPQLSHVDELWRERPDGAMEFVARFWYRPKS